MLIPLPEPLFSLWFICLLLRTTPFFLSPPPITVSLSSSSSLTAPNPVLSQRIRQSRASEPEAGQKRSFVRAWLCVCEGEAEKRGEGGKKKKVVCTVRGEQPPQHWMMLHQKGGGSQMGRMQHSCPRFKPSWKGWIWLVGGCTPTSTADSRSWVVFFFLPFNIFSPLLAFPSLLPFIFFPDHYPPSSQVSALDCSFVLLPFHSLCALYLKLPSVVTSASIRAPQMFFSTKKKKD